MREVLAALSQYNVPPLAPAPLDSAEVTKECLCCDGSFTQGDIVCIPDHGFFCLRCVYGAFLVLFEQTVGLAPQVPGYIMDDIFHGDVQPNPHPEVDLNQYGLRGTLGIYRHQEPVRSIGCPEVAPLWDVKAKRCDGCGLDYLEEDMRFSHGMPFCICNACWFNSMHILCSMELAKSRVIG